MEIRVGYISGFSGVITLIMMCYFANAIIQVEGEVPCFFIFGDSLVDNGNNNDILTFVKSNFIPYGIDFPQGPTGRFCNGRTFVDVLAELLGFSDYIPPFSRASDYDITKGVNFASGAAGIRDESGNYLGANVPMNKQISNFAIIVEQIREYFKGDEITLKNYLSKCIYYSGIGNNDYLNNYFMAWRYPTSSIYTPQEYAVELLQAYKLQLTALYDLGARKVVVPGIGQMGCIPIRRVKNGTHESLCNEDDNNVVQLFNSGLRDLVDTFNNARLPGAKFVYVDFFQGCKDLHSNRTYFGLEVVDKGCCGVGENINGGEVTCLPLQTPCKDRTKYLFWDAFHPSELVHLILAKRAYSSKTDSYAYPINIKQLAML